MAPVSVNPSEKMSSMSLDSLRGMASVSVRPIPQQSYNIFHQSGVNYVVLHCIASSSFTLDQIIAPLNVLLIHDILWAAAYRDMHLCIPSFFNYICLFGFFFILSAVRMEEGAGAC